jgi:hypothetical protein
MGRIDFSTYFFVEKPVARRWPTLQSAAYQGGCAKFIGV